MVILEVYAASDEAHITLKDNLYGKPTAVTGTEDNGDLGRKYGESATNDYGMRLRHLSEFMSPKNMNEYFLHKDKHKFTWVHATRELRSIIDYITQILHSKLKTTGVQNVDQTITYSLPK